MLEALVGMEHEVAAIGHRHQVHQGTALAQVLQAPLRKEGAAIDGAIGALVLGQQAMQHVHRQLLGDLIETQQIRTLRSGGRIGGAEVMEAVLGQPSPHRILSHPLDGCVLGGGVEAEAERGIAEHQGSRIGTRGVEQGLQLQGHQGAEGMAHQLEGQGGFQLSDRQSLQQVGRQRTGAQAG